MPFLLIFFGVIGGLLGFGFIGVFLGPTLLAVGYRLLKEWADTPEPAIDTGRIVPVRCCTRWIYFQGEGFMARAVTLFTGQWADLSFDQVCPKAKSFGYDGVELACWGDHFEVDQGAEGQELLQGPMGNPARRTA